MDVRLDPQRGTLDIILDQHGTTYSSRIISEGTLRVLALCAVAASPWPASLLAFEEPENGVQPRRIELIAKLVEKMARGSRNGGPPRQVVITTHSPTLLATMFRLKRNEPDAVTLLRCSQVGDSTRLDTIDKVEPLFESTTINESLQSPEDPANIESMIVRGYFDG